MTARLPKHLLTPEGRRRLMLLRREANGLRAYYGVPVYLTGSALFDFNAEPRDWDLRIMLPDARFARRFGPVDEWIRGVIRWNLARQRWADECVKRSQHASHAVGLNVDVQVYPRTWARSHYRRRPRLQLDRCRT